MRMWNHPGFCCCRWWRW